MLTLHDLRIYQKANLISDEGYGRFHYKENKLFCFYSRGSLLETIDWLEKCKRRKIIEEEKTIKIIIELNDLHQKLNAYIRTIGKQ